MHLTHSPTKHHSLASPTLNMLKTLTAVYSWAKSSNTKPIIKC